MPASRANRLDVALVHLPAPNLEVFRIPIVSATVMSQEIADHEREWMEGADGVYDRSVRFEESESSL